MPIRYRAEHFEFPKHLELPVFPELPPEYEERLSFGAKRAWTKIKDSNGKTQEMKMLTFCRNCGGWVPGEPHEHEVNNLDGRHLAGRKGTEEYCPRCAQKIAFTGMMS